VRKQVSNSANTPTVKTPYMRDMLTYHLTRLKKRTLKKPEESRPSWWQYQELSDLTRFIKIITSIVTMAICSVKRLFSDRMAKVHEEDLGYYSFLMACKDLSKINDIAKYVMDQMSYILIVF